jgi:glutamyl-Q tRNA(Asp) synthetase
LDARQNHGLWLLRIDDLDTPRNSPGAVDAILNCLEAFGLDWDGEIYYESQHISAYYDAIAEIQNQLYACNCSRKILQDYPGVYPGFCRNKQQPKQQAYALRVKAPDSEIRFTDRTQGIISTNLARSHGDFIIKRRDAIIAYQLAVVIDDHLQAVTHIVRGADLLDSTAKQIYLQQLLKLPQSEYLHVPVIVDQHGEKLSKQTRAQAIDHSQPHATLFLLLQLLKQNPPPELCSASTQEIISWGVAHWQPQNLCRQLIVNQP